MSKKLSEEKKEITRKLLETYDIKTTGDIQSALKDLLGGTIQEMLESELDEHMGYGKSEQNGEKKTNYRNGHKPKTLKSTVGELAIEVPQDRNSTFEPRVVPKHKRDISEIEEKIGEVESAKFWLSVLNSLKNRGVRDILTICADGLAGISEAIQVAFPQTEYQRCIVHMVRNTLKHVSEKNRKAFAADLKRIYHAPDEETGHQTMLEVKEKWDRIYPNAMKRWVDDWSAVCPVFKYSAAVRKVLYTTNVIESLNSQYRKLNSTRSVFPSDEALKKALYLSTLQITKKWTMKIHNWGMISGELSIHFEGRLI